MFIDELSRYAELYRNDSFDSASSLFGDAEELKPVRPEMPDPAAEEDNMVLLQQEKDLVGRYISAHPLDAYDFEMRTFTTVSLSGLPEMIDRCSREQKNEKVRIGGLVTEVQQKTTKTGAAGKVVTLEDASGVYEMALFGQSNEKFMTYMEKNSALFIEGEIAPRYRLSKEDQAAGKRPAFSFRITSIVYLGNVNETLLQSIAVQIETERINPAFRSELLQTLKSFKGKTSLDVSLLDKQHGWVIPFHSRKYGVTVNDEFINALERMGLTYTVQHK